MLFRTATQLHYHSYYLVNTNHAMKCRAGMVSIRSVMGNRTRHYLHGISPMPHRSGPFQPSASPHHLEAHCYYPKRHNKHFKGSDPNQMICAFTLPADQWRGVAYSHLFQSDIPSPSPSRCDHTTRTVYSSWTRPPIRHRDSVFILPPSPDLSKSWSTKSLQIFSVCTIQSQPVRNLLKPQQQQV